MKPVWRCAIHLRCFLGCAKRRRAVRLRSEFRNYLVFSRNSFAVGCFRMVVRLKGFKVGFSRLEGRTPILLVPIRIDHRVWVWPFHLGLEKFVWRPLNAYQARGSHWQFVNSGSILGWIQRGCHSTANLLKLDPLVAYEPIQFVFNKTF